MAFVTLFGSEINFTLPNWIFSELVLCLMAAVYSVTYLVLSHENEEEIEDEQQ